MHFLIEYLKAILVWLLSFVGWAVVEVVKLVCAGLLTVIDAIPVPDWVWGAGAAFAALPNSVAYFSGALHLAEGITIVLGAYTIRFLIRRIPIIG